MRDLGIIIAHELSPSSGSECANGWNILNNLQNPIDIVVFYARSNQSLTNDYEKEIGQYHAVLAARGIYAVSIEYPWYCRALSRLSFLLSRDRATGYRAIYFLNYKIWLMRVRKRIVKEKTINNVRFIHLLNHISFREPGRFYDLDVPMIWGPISGLARIKNAFMDGRPLELMVNRLRNISNWLAIKSRNVKRTCKQASHVFAVTNEDIQLLPECSGKTTLLPDVGCDILKSASYRSSSSLCAPFKLLWVGRIDRNKALHILFHALSGLEDNHKKFELTVIGSGPLINEMKRLAARDCPLLTVTWMGQVQRDSVFDAMKSHDLFVLTSIKEAACTSVMEALSHGLPVVCHDAFGMSASVDDTCGWKVEYHSPRRSIDGFREVLASVAERPDRLIAKARGALVRRQNLSWKMLATRLSNVYIEISRDRDA